MKLDRQKRKYPFLFLVFVHSLLVLYTFYKKKDRKSLSIVLSSFIGIAYIFDYVIIAIFGGYTYKPNIFKKKPLDKYLGSLFSQGVYVPFTALFITAFQLGWKVKILFGLYFSIIENLFLRLNIYKHHWWRTIYTFVLIVLSFKGNDIWYEQLKKKNRAVLFLSLYFMIQTTWQNTMFVFTIFRKILYGKGKVKDLKEHFKLAPLHGMILSLYLAWQVRSHRAWSKGKMLLTMLIVDVYLMRKGVMRVQSVSLLFIKYTIIFVSASIYQRLIYTDIGPDDKQQS
ncbi:hypothetical protein [Halalkalibacter alkalisediminis]|uniref:Uncharacterized protein n=1 Tax=Halalkalibacter alkalisediminis TaxID=935616 RepID=A0ABV6NDV1_9BACI|nr:hypothetical protein [Halalkalibacter alkalisediminis]